MPIQFPGLAFKSETLITEFADTSKTDPRVRSLAFELAFVASQHGFTLTVTQISRSKESQVAIYGEDRPSGHRETPVRAIDFSVKGLGHESIDLLIAHFAAYLKTAQYYALLCHDKGSGLHLHLQVPHCKYNQICK